MNMQMSREQWAWEARMIDMDNRELDRQYLEEQNRGVQMNDKAFPRGCYWSVKRYEPNSGGPSKYSIYWRPGTIHGFMKDADGEPCAIVEDERSLTIVMPYATWVCFAAIPPGNVDKQEKP